VILELCGDAPLVGLLTIRQLRRVRRLESGETRAELSVDEVEVLGDDRTLDRFESSSGADGRPEEPLHSSARCSIAMAGCATPQDPSSTGRWGHPRRPADDAR